MILTVIDWETLGLRADTKVLSLGAATFDITKATKLSKYYAKIDLADQKNRSEDQSTIDWWAKQSDAAKDAAFDLTNAVSLRQAIGGLTAHILHNNSQGIIGNGIRFDNNILADACEELKMSYPVMYWSDFDLRTMKLMAGIDRPAWPQGLIPHHALHDAIYEAECARAYWAATRHG